MKINSKTVLLHTFLLIAVYLLLLPVMYMVSAGFRSNQSIYAPMFDMDTWTDSRNTNRETNKLTKHSLKKNIMASITAAGSPEINKSEEFRLLEKAVAKWVNSCGKEKQYSEFIAQYNKFTPLLRNEQKETLDTTLFQPDGTLRYVYEKRISFDNFKTFFTGTSSSTRGITYPISQWFGNSMIIACSVTVIQVIIVILAAFAISRYRFTGRKVIVLLVVVLQVFPGSMTMIALYLFLDYMGGIVPQIGLDTIPGLILIYLGAGVPLNIWLAKGYFSTLPPSLEESAMVDGASYTQTFFYIILPVVMPVVAVIAILSFISVYNEFLLATFILTKPEHYTLPVGLSFFIGGETINFGIFSAIAIIGSIPVLIIWLFLQKYIIAGLTHSSVKD